MSTDLRPPLLFPKYLKVGVSRQGTISRSSSAFPGMLALALHRLFTCPVSRKSFASDALISTDRLFFKERISGCSMCSGYTLRSVARFESGVGHLRIGDNEYSMTRELIVPLILARRDGDLPEPSACTSRADRDQQRNSGLIKEAHDLLVTPRRSIIMLSRDASTPGCDVWTPDLTIISSSEASSPAEHSHIPAT